MAANMQARSGGFAACVAFAAGLADFTSARPLVLAAGASFTLTGGFFLPAAGAASRALNALAQGIHQVDDLAALRFDDLVLRDGQVLDLGFDEFLQCGFVAVGELAGVELGGALLDQRLGEFERVLVDGDLLDVAEVLRWLAQFFLVAHGVGHHAAFVAGRGGDGEDVLAAAEGDLAQAGLLRFGEGGADDGEGLGLDVVFGDDEVGLLEVFGREFVERDELLDFDGVLGGDAQVGDLGGLDDDVLALGVFVTLYDLILLDRRGGLVGRLLRARRRAPSGGARARR